MTECDEKKIVTDIVSTKKANTVATNVSSSATVNCVSKKVSLFLIILLLIIIIICYHYAKKRCNIKWEKVRVKYLTCYYFNDIIKLEDFDFDNILVNQKLHQNILIYDISYETLIGTKPLPIRFDKIDTFIKISDGTRYLTLFDSEKYDVILKQN